MHFCLTGTLVEIERECIPYIITIKTLYFELKENLAITKETISGLSMIIDSETKAFLCDDEIDENKRADCLLTVAQKWTTVNHFKLFFTIVSEQQRSLEKTIRQELLKHLIRIVEPKTILYDPGILL